MQVGRTRPHTSGMPATASTESNQRLGGSRHRRSDGEDRRTQAQRSGETTEQLVAAARRLFAEKGFAGTSTEEIVRTASVTRGAMYHHFTSKEDLFEAVFRREQEAIARRVQQTAAKKKGAWAQLKAGCDEFLTASLDPEIQQITLIDAPAVLGLNRINELECPRSMQMLSNVIERAMQEGTLRRRPVMPVAQLLFGALCQAAIVAAQASDGDATMKQMRRELQRLLDGMQAT